MDRFRYQGNLICYTFICYRGMDRNVIGGPWGQLCLRWLLDILPFLATTALQPVRKFYNIRSI